jgi:preflagellin peptidase FlaK
MFLTRTPRLRFILLPFVDLLRLFTGATLLAFAAFTDWKWRRAPNVLWLVMAGIALALLAVQAALDWPDFVSKWPYLVGAPVFAAVIYGLWWVGLLAGGADAKALMAIALLLPFPLSFTEALPVWQSVLPGSFAVLGNGLLAFLLVPLGLLAWNLAHGDLRFPHLFVGVKRRAAEVHRGHQWPMEIVDATGARRTRLFASRMSSEEIAETFERVQALGDARVWVSPKIPFMLPLLAGFLLAFLAGDLMLGAMERILPTR